MSNLIIVAFSSFSLGFSLAVLVLYKMRNNRTPIETVLKQLAPQAKYKARVPGRD